MSALLDLNSVNLSGLTPVSLVAWRQAISFISSLFGGEIDSIKVTELLH
jgi:hypothetical protein